MKNVFVNCNFQIIGIRIKLFPSQTKRNEFCFSWKKIAIDIFYGIFKRLTQRKSELVSGILTDSIYEMRSNFLCLVENAANIII